jgi:glycosyltransferase involved in cell wall biosynthesis
MEKYKLTFIIPVYNRESIIVSCLNSVISANLNDKLQIVVVDDCSTDNTVNEVKSQAQQYPNITLIELDKNSGPGVARNVGIDNAAGEFIIFLDSDDFIETKNIEFLMCALSHDIDIIFYNTNYGFDGVIHGMNSPAIMKECVFEKDSFFNHFTFETMFTCWRFCYNKKFLLDERIRFPDIYIGEDICFTFLVLASMKKIKVINHAVYFHNRVAGHAHLTMDIKNTYPNFLESFLIFSQSIMRKCLALSEYPAASWLQNYINFCTTKGFHMCDKLSMSVIDGAFGYFFSKLKEIQAAQFIPLWFMSATNMTLKLAEEVTSRTNFKVAGFLNDCASISAVKPIIIVLFANTKQYYDDALPYLTENGYVLMQENGYCSPHILARHDFYNIETAKSTMIKNLTNIYFKKYVGSRVVVWGVNDIIRHLISVSKILRDALVKIVDINYENFTQETYCGLSVEHPNALKDFQFDYIITPTTKRRGEIIEHCHKMGISPKFIEIEEQGD